MVRKKDGFKGEGKEVVRALTWFSDGFGVGIVIFSSGYQTFPGLPSTCLIAIAEGIIEILAYDVSVYKTIITGYRRPSSSGA